jgi:hypothetical protein
LKCQKSNSNIKIQILRRANKAIILVFGKKTSHRLKFPDKICDRKKCKEIFLMRFYKKINFVKFKTPLRVL